MQPIIQNNIKKKKEPGRGSSGVLPLKLNKLSPELQQLLINKAEVESRSDWVAEALEEKFYRETYPKIWMIEWIEANYDLIGKLRRKIGAERRKKWEKENK